MWFFSKKEPTRALKRLQEDMEDLKVAMNGLQLDWSNVYGKIRTTMGRITKSAAILEANQTQPEESGAGAPPTPLPSGSRPEVLAALEEIAKRRGYQRIG